MKDPMERTAFLYIVAPGEMKELDNSALNLLELVKNRPDLRDRVMSVWKHTRDIWEEADNALDFLFHSHPMLGDERPVDATLASDAGAERVHQILGRLRYGTAA